MQELKNKEAAVVVFSGGQDSTTCLFWALKRYKKVIALSFDYHQKHVKELECAKKICRDHEVEHHIMDMSLLNQLAPNSLTRVDIKVDESAPESIHLCDYPVANEAYIDKTLEENMDEVLKIVVMGRACRNTANIKNRQPIGKMFVKGASDLPEFYQDIVTDELNVKEIELTDDVRAFTSYTFKPQLKTVGPKYGKLLGGIKNELSNLDGNAAMDELNATGVLKLQVNGQEIELAKEDLLIDMAQMEGYVSESDYGITVVLDTNLTEELLTEGFVREIISKIQTMRKEAGFEVMDKIKVTYDGSEKAEKVFAEYAEQIGQETLAVAVEKAEPAGYVKDWKINGEAVNMGVEKQGE